MSGERRSAEYYPQLVGPATLAEARFVPQRYEPNYAYPLLVMLHGRGGDEQQLVRALPSLSWRNYVGLGLRGPELLERQGIPIGFGWGPSFSRTRRLPNASLHAETPEAPAETFRRLLSGDTQDPDAWIEDGLFEAVRGVRRSLHVHSERIFLVGVGEGAALAYRIGLSYPDRIAGVVSLNGWLPAGAFRAPVRLDACRSLRFLAIHGEWNSRVPSSLVRRDVATLRAAGLRVAFQSYPTANRLTKHMLADVDRWLMHQFTSSDTAD